MRSAIAAAATATLCLTLSACTSTVPGTPTADPTAIKLDTGNFPTTPRKVTAGTPADAWVQESWRMADGVIEPWSIDPSLTNKVPETITSPLVAPVQFGIDIGDKFKSMGWPQVFTPEQVRTLKSVPFLGGFIAQTGDSDTPSRTLAVGMLRFADAATASRAVEALRVKDEPSPGAFSKIDGARSLGTDSTPDTQKVAAITQRGDLLLIAHARADTRETATTLVGKALTAQVSKLPTYRPTLYLGLPPLDVDMDRDGIVSRTLSGSGGSEIPVGFGLSRNNSPLFGYRTPYAKNLALPSQREVWNKDVTDYGVDLESVIESTHVQRMRDPAVVRRNYAAMSATPEIMSRNEKTGTHQ